MNIIHGQQIWFTCIYFIWCLIISFWEFEFKGESVLPLHLVIFCLIQIHFGGHYCEEYSMHVKSCPVRNLIHMFSPCCLLASRRNKIEKWMRCLFKRALRKQALLGATSITSVISGLGILYWLSPEIVYLTEDLGKLHSRIKIWGKSSRWFDGPKWVRPSPFFISFLFWLPLGPSRDERPQSTNDIRWRPSRRGPD